jgi:hypothetical protein
MRGAASVVETVVPEQGGRGGNQQGCVAAAAPAGPAACFLDQGFERLDVGLIVGARLAWRAGGKNAQADLR